MPPKIIGISGTNGSGKDTVGMILADNEHGYLFVSVSDMLRSELKKQGVKLTREATRGLSAAWRREFGLGVMIDKAVNEYERVGGDKSFKGLAVASLRSPAEADAIHERGGIVLWLDADPKLRYDRISASLDKRGKDRAATDEISFAKFIADEDAEMSSDNNDPSQLSMLDVKAKSDLFLINDSYDIDQLKLKLNKLLGFS